MKILNFNEYMLVLEADDITATAPISVEPIPATPSAPPPDMSFSSSTPDAFSDAALPPDPNAPVQTDEPSTIRMIFLDKDKDWHSQYSDGGGVKRFKEYEVPTADFEKWLTDNNLIDNRELIFNSINGKQTMPPDIYDKLKTAFTSDKLGKDRGDIDIDYDNKNIPSTSDLEIIFIKKD